MFIKKDISLKEWLPLIWLFLFVTLFVSLFAVGLFILNPAKHQASEDNAKRQADLMLIANALAQYIRSNQGALPRHLSSQDQELSSSGVDICRLLTPEYMTSLPTDPSLDAPDITQPCTYGYRTKYHITIDNNNAITLSAPATAIPPATAVITIIRNTYEK